MAKRTLVNGQYRGTLYISASEIGFAPEGWMVTQGLYWYKYEDPLADVLL